MWKGLGSRILLHMLYVRNSQDTDYVLLPTYTKGRYLILENPTGILAINEIEMEFSEAHSAPPLKERYLYDLLDPDSGTLKSWHSQNGERMGSKHPIILRTSFEYPTRTARRCTAQAPRLRTGTSWTRGAKTGRRTIQRSTARKAGRTFWRGTPRQIIIERWIRWANTYVPHSFWNGFNASSKMEALKWRSHEEYKLGTRTYDDFFIGVERIHEYVLGTLEMSTLKNYAPLTGSLRPAIMSCKWTCGTGTTSTPWPDTDHSRSPQNQMGSDFWEEEQSFHSCI